MSKLEQPNLNESMLKRIDRELPQLLASQDATSRQLDTLSKRVDRLDERVDKIFNDGNGDSVYSRLKRVEGTTAQILTRMGEQDAALEQLEAIQTGQNAIQSEQKKAAEQRITTHRAVGLVLLTFLLSSFVAPLMSRWMNPQPHGQSSQAAEIADDKVMKALKALDERIGALTPAEPMEPEAQKKPVTIRKKRGKPTSDLRPTLRAKKLGEVSNWAAPSQPTPRLPMEN